MIKDHIRPFVRPLPQWSAVAVGPPQGFVTATLRGNGNPQDATADHTVASLIPLVIASSLDAGERPRLEYLDNATGKSLGFLRLTRTTEIAPTETPLAFYRIASGEQRCLGWPLRPWNAWLQKRAMLKNRKPHDFFMEPAAVQQLMVSYLCPRPVVLVSIAAADHRNIFPMDLIGPLQRSGCFSLALRSTNVSVPFMREARRVALSSMPATKKAEVYKLGGHHKQLLGEWNTLPFPLRPSREFGIPAVAAALQVRELQIREVREIGSHTFFLGRIVSDEGMTGETQLHHTAGFHQAYRRRRGEPFAEA
jgi:flavin reductase (DIM6/NTAB) family NADH-FMN oxidoreductase RutF